MSQSLSQLYTHLVFGTKYRVPMISEAIEPQLHAYIAGILKAHQSPALEINSVPDHIHILFRLSKNIALAKIVEEVKKESSKWMKKQKNGHLRFTWQGGYGAFSVGSSQLDTVRRYIQNQKEHHKVHTFKNEIETFMKKYNVIHYQGKYFWR